MGVQWHADEHDTRTVPSRARAMAHVGGHIAGFRSHKIKPKLRTHLDLVEHWPDLAAREQLLEVGDTEVRDPDVPH